MLYYVYVRGVAVVLRLLGPNIAPLGVRGRTRDTVSGYLLSRKLHIPSNP